MSSASASRVLALGAALLIAVRLAGQGGAPALTVLSIDGRRTLPVTVINEREFVALDDLAAAFQLVVRQEAGAVTVTHQGQTIVLTPDQALASVAGRLISLPAAPTRSGGRLLVPLEFVSRALAPVYPVPLDLRRPSRLLVVGDLQVPRVTVVHDAARDAARLTIESTPRTVAAVSHDGGRLTIRFEADALDLALPDVPAQGFVQGLRLADPVTLAVDLGPRFATYRTSTQTSDSASRLSIDLLSLTAEAAPTPSAAPGAPAGDPRPLAAPSPPIATLVLDPGHGGDDAGVQSGGVAEKDVTLAVARRLKALVEERLGIRVLLTREDDRSVPLDRRTAVANNNKADVFISLHANASPRAAASGASIRIAAFDDEERARGARTSERVPVLGGGARDIDLVAWDLAQVRHADRSAELAAIVEAQFRARVPLEDRAVGHEPLRVLQAANMPAILVEMGYLTNAQQAADLRSAEFQATVAQALFDAIVRFRDVLGAGGRP